VPPAWAAQVGGAKQRAHHDRGCIFVASSLATLRTSHLFSQAGVHLLGNDYFLDFLEQVLGFRQLQAQRVNAHVSALEMRHLVHDWRMVVISIALDHDLHAYSHAVHPI